MREILFRGKRLDNGEWVFSGNIIRFIPENGEDLIFIPALSEPCTCYHDEKDNIIAFEKGIFYKVDTKTVGQYTGLKDKNGKRIWEGDIIDASGEWWDANGPAGHSSPIIPVEWCEYYCGFDPFANYDCDCGVFIYANNCIVIGNIHDNPELLEK